MTPAVEERAKYTQKEVDALGAKGHAFKNPDGSFSYPIDDAEDLSNAIKAVGRGNADHDAIRKYIIGRAKALGKSGEIPESWNADGSLSQSNSAKPRRRKYKRAVPLAPEIRNFSAHGLEVRSQLDEGAEIVVTGTPVVYGTPYTVADMLGEFQETMAPGVASAVLDRGVDCRFLINHTGMALARTASGTLELRDSPSGLQFVARLDPNNTEAANLASAIARGDITQMSVGFTVANDDWEERSDGFHRTIYSFGDLKDVSAVTYPCSPATSIELAQRMAANLQEEGLTRINALYREVRAGKVLSQANADQIKHAVLTLHDVLNSAGIEPNEENANEDSEDTDPDGTAAGNDVIDDGTGNEDGTGTRAEDEMAVSNRSLSTALALEQELLSIRRARP